MALEERLAHSGGVAGAFLLGLFNEVDAFVGAELGDDFFFGVADDDEARVTSAAKQASRIEPSMGLPQTSWRGLGCLDFIRVDLPAARMMAVRLMGEVGRGKKELPGLDSNQDKENQNLLCYRYTTG